MADLSTAREVRQGFDLAAALEEWRASFATNLAFGADDIAELECHLVEAVAQAEEEGRDPERAFRRAASGLGSSDHLTEDYLTAASPGRKLLYHTQETAMKYVLPASIVFAALLVAFAPGDAPAGPNYQLAVGGNGETYRLDTRSGELCRIALYPGSPMTVEGCLASPEDLVDPTLAQVSGQVYRDGGEVPAANVRVTVGGEGAVTDRRGRYHIALDRSGPQEISAVLRGMEVASTVDLEAGRHTVHDLVLPPPSDARYVVQGQIVHPGVGPVAEVRVYSNEAESYTDANGLYTLVLDTGGWTTVHAAGEGLTSAYSRVRVGSASATPLNFLVELNPVNGRGKLVVRD
ncbi:MAG: carboxypeptidase regulatory-like domain-containing protein [Rhodothermales bacterium]|nr:carboxypeptidase regulatory-like domain-containing protein [Rhodothermales bacterium]MBO6778114.1 carboxypeptidase regulatory-like domain-containing protein [Rhodothermales bacterium]